MRNTRKEQMFSAVLPAADIRHGISKATASILEGEAKTSRPDDTGMRPGLCDELCPFWSRRQG
jgi:hypothetical protein